MQREAKTLGPEDVLYYEHCTHGIVNWSCLTVGKLESGKPGSGTSDEGSNNFIRGGFLFKFGFGWFGWFFVCLVYT